MMRHVFNEANSIASKSSFIHLSSTKLLAMVSQPVSAVILLFPQFKDLAEKRKAEDVRIAKEGQDKLDKTIFWMKQTVRFKLFVLM